jgi:AcrR family transcriptional regulator
MAVKTAAILKAEEAGSRRRERMRLILIEAATRLFAKQGVDATTIDEIVDLAGVAKGTFYNYFTDRSDIAHAVAATMRHAMNAAVEELNEGIDDPAERISRGLRLFLALVAYDPIAARMLARLYEGGANIASHGNQHLLGDLADGIEQGRIRVPNIDVALHLVVSLGTIGMRHLLDVGADEEIKRGEGYGHALAVVLLQGLGVKPTDIERILKRPFDVGHLGIWK